MRSKLIAKRYLTIQEHDARVAGLHWDLRISYSAGPSEQMSWVVPKHEYPGKFDEKKLAIRVDDHPWSYRNFEGELKSGYGAGTVKLVFAGWVPAEVTDKKIKFIHEDVEYRLVKGPGKKWFWFKA